MIMALPWIEFDNKSKLVLSATIEEIQRYSEKVRKAELACNLPPCLRCGVHAEYFKRHEKRQRKFYVIVNQDVQTVPGLLGRWKCSGCGKTFTDYPDFAIPYKRCTLPTIIDMSCRYVEDNDTSYRKIVDEIPLQYHESKEMLEHSTIHRWITTLSKFADTVANAVDLILQAAPASTLCRELAALTISYKKYRSEMRKRVLFQCRQLLNVHCLYRLIFDVSIFPKLATNNRFR
jgi:transposase-like protein